MEKKKFAVKGFVSIIENEIGDIQFLSGGDVSSLGPTLSLLMEQDEDFFQIVRQAVFASTKGVVDLWDVRQEHEAAVLPKKSFNLFRVLWEICVAVLVTAFVLALVYAAYNHVGEKKLPNQKDLILPKCDTCRNK